MSKSGKKFVVIAEDYNSPFFRNYLFVKGTSNYKKMLGIDGPTMAIFSRENKIQYLTQMSTWKKAHEDFKKRALKDPSYVEKLIDLADEQGKKMNQWTEKNIFRANLRGKTNKQLVSLWVKFNEFGSNEYTYGVTLPILDFQGFSLVENSIKNFLQNKVPPEKFQHYFSVFTEPQFNSFSQEQEIGLLKIIKKHYSDLKWRKDIMVHDLGAIRKKYLRFYKDLERHAKRYAWVYYVYRGPAYTERNFLDFVRHSLSKETHPGKYLKALQKKRQMNARLKNKYLKELRPDSFSAAMLKLAAKLVWAKPRRKDYQSKSYYHMEKLQHEIGRRLFLGLEQVRSLPIDLVEKSLFSGKNQDRAANEIYRSHICVKTGHNTVAILSGKKADTFAKKNFIKTLDGTTDGSPEMTEFIGQVAFPGKITGKVKIINRLEEMHKMETGNILVSIATTPSIVPAMKKAAAILTDEGGLTCHASIVSREMEIPCVVGLKNISKFLKDGDRVEVDAKHGKITKL